MSMYNVHIVKLEAEIRKICSSKEPNKKTKIITIQVGRNWGAEGAQAPHLFWIYIVKISKFLKFGKKFFFLFSRAPP